jgi:putative ABC transport system substrate-binding protein
MDSKTLLAAVHMSLPGTPQAVIGWIENPAAQQPPAVTEVCYPFRWKRGRDRVVNRRSLITLLGGAAAAWPFAARAQQSAMQVVGLLRNTPSASFEYIVAAFRRGLSEEGFVDGRNVAVQQRWAEGRDERLRALLADLISLNAAVIVANTIAALAAKAAGTTIPVVFATGSDPVRDGLVDSLSRPGGNFTGVVFLSSELGTKRLDLLRQLAPKASTIAVLLGPSTVPEVVAEHADVEKAARMFGLNLVAAEATNAAEIVTAFAKFIERGAGALFVGTGAFTNSHREAIVSLAARHAIPAMYSLREFAFEGGLISYGTSITDAYRQAGTYVGRILKGERPGDLPVQQPTKFKLVINLKAAKALGTEIPPTLLSLADEVIE